MFTRYPLLLIGVVLFGLFGAVALSTRSTDSVECLVSVSLFDDRFNPLVGGVARVRNATQDEVVQVTDQEGQGGWAALECSGPLELTLMDHQGPGGLSLGLQFQDQLEASVPAQSAAQWQHLAYTQPLAVPLHLSGDAQSPKSFYPQLGAFPIYGLHLPTGSTLRFSPLCASLKDGGEVAAYLRYRGRPSLDTDYCMGAVLVTREVDLGLSSSQGPNGLTLTINLLGNQPADTAQIDLCEVRSPNGGQGSGIVQALPLTATIIERSVEHDLIVVRLLGRIQTGQVAILVRDQIASPPGKHTWVDAPPVVTIPPNAGSGTAWLGPAGDPSQAVDCECAAVGLAASGLPALTDCEPSVPNMPPDWSCEPLPPESPCPLVPHGERQCQTRRFRSPRICKSPGGTFEVKVNIKLSVKLSFQIGGESGLGSEKKLKTGSGFEFGFEASFEATEEWTAEPGAHGLGQCKRWYRIVLVCLQEYSTHTMGHEDHGEYSILHPCHVPTETKSTCTDWTLTESVCDRTP